MAQRRRSNRKRADRGPDLTPGVLKEGLRRRRPPSGPRKIPLRAVVVLGVLMAMIAIAVIANYLVSVKGPEDIAFLRVNDRTYSFREYVSLLKSEKAIAENMGIPFEAGTAPYSIIQRMADDELIRQLAPAEGIEVTDEDILAEGMRRLLTNSDDLGDDQGLIDREYGVRLKNYLTRSQLSSSQYEDQLRVALQRQQLKDQLGARISRVQPQVFLNMIEVGDQSIATVEGRLKDGEPFSRVARELSQDEESRRRNGAVGWLPRLVMLDQDLLLFGLAEGEISDAFSTDEGAYIIRLIEKIDDDGARLHAILVEDFSAGRDALRSLDTGIGFQELSAEISIDPELRAKRGDLGVVRVGDFDGIFDPFIRGLPIGEYSPTISTMGSTMILMVSERSPAVEVSDENIEKLEGRALEAWLSEQTAKNTVSYCPDGDDNCFGSKKVNRALSQLADTSKTKFEQQATATAEARRSLNQNPLGL